MSVWSCPICGGGMQHRERSLVCRAGHTFDQARSGYVNLLPVSRKHAKNPGDNALMVQARRAFLDAGYYAPLREAVAETVARWMPQQQENRVLLDAGCGEGYYTAHVAEVLQQQAPGTHCYGVDIAKTAADAAAKRCKTVQFAVGSCFHLPVSDGCCDLLLSMFAPYCGGEFHRVLKPGGCMILVIPGAQHLMGLKRAIYDQPYANTVQDYPLEGFAFRAVERVAYDITLPDPETIRNLFAMTPYYYKTGKEEHARLEALTSLETEVSFEILIYQKEV